MIELTVNTLWKGAVAIREKYLIEALRTGEDIKITCGERSMVIPNEELQSHIWRVSKKPMQDRFGDEPHYLIYYRWLPQEDDAKIQVFL